MEKFKNVTLTFGAVVFTLRTLVLCSSWGIPLAITIAAVSLNKIGYDASEVSVGWCWVRINIQDRVLWMLLTGKIWEFLAYLTLPFLYILIKRHIHIAVRRTPGTSFISHVYTELCDYLNMSLCVQKSVYTLRTTTNLQIHNSFSCQALKSSFLILRYSVRAIHSGSVIYIHL